MCALVRTPIQVTSRTALGGDDPNDVGVTTAPPDFVVPLFNIVPQQQRRVGWFYHLQINRPAAEGTNRSRYLGVGVYSTDRMFAFGGMTNFIPGPNRRQIYTKIDAATAALNRQAEQEHCNDILRGYRITVGAVQAALEQIRLQRGGRGPYQKRDQAMRAARRALVDAVGHNRLKELFRKNVGDLAVDRYGFAEDLRKLCKEVMDRTQQRDGNGWHTFVPGRAVTFWDLTWSEWWNWDQNSIDLRMLVRGATFRVPGDATNTLIHL